MILLLAMLALAEGQFWRVHINPYVDNVSLVTITECKGDTPFYAYDEFPIVDASIDVVQVRRQQTPRGARCTVRFDVMREDEQGNPSIGESIIVIQEDGNE